MYVVPLQQDLDLTLLPSDAKEFKTMPKAACQVCKENMPLHILALHVKNCAESLLMEEDNEVNLNLIYIGKYCAFSVYVYTPNFIAIYIFLYLKIQKNV